VSELVVRLAANLSPVPRAFVARRLLVGIGAGLAVSIALVLALLGPRPDMRAAVATPMFWMKLAYPLSLAMIAGLASERLARPAASARARIVWLGVPVLFVIMVAAVQLASAPPGARMGLLMGGSARLCPFLVLASAVPPWLGLVWAMRGLAPTRLGEAGAIIGLAAGGAGAFAYAWHCTETGGPFLAVWYTLGISAAALLGWLLGPRILRW
jgi:hypothetical protein